MEELFWSKVDKTDACWLWIAASTPSGYGMFGRYAAGRSQRAHRIAWELVNGPISRGQFVLHRCNVKRCVRPDHLYIGGPKENAQDLLATGWNPGRRSEETRRRMAASWTTERRARIGALTAERNRPGGDLFAATRGGGS